MEIGTIKRFAMMLLEESKHNELSGEIFPSYCDRLSVINFIGKFSRRKIN